MTNLKEITLDEYYDLPKSKLVNYEDSKGYQRSRITYPKPKQGKVYRHPNVTPRSSRTVNLTTIIGLVKEPNPDFPMTGPPIIKEIHIEEHRVYVKKED